MRPRPTRSFTPCRRGMSAPTMPARIAGAKRERALKHGHCWPPRMRSGILSPGMVVGMFARRRRGHHAGITSGPSWACTRGAPPEALRPRGRFNEMVCVSTLLNRRS